MTVSCSFLLLILLSALPFCVMTQGSCFGKPVTDPTVCNGKGLCTARNVCTCFPGYLGSQCAFPGCYGDPSNFPGVCNGNGNCSSPDVCTCYSGWNGLQCNVTSCFGVPANSPTVCSGFGQCVSANTCSCTPDYSGAQCQTPRQCFGLNFTDARVCNGKGTCVLGGTCQCQSGWSGSQCNVSAGCFNRTSEDPLLCGGILRGSCTDLNNCTCYSGYAGNQCQDVFCFGINSTLPTVCSSRGACVDANNCSCSNGFAGPTCSLFLCSGRVSSNPSVCSGTGSCVGANNCTCNSGYIGLDCEETICFGKNASDSSVCSANGNCTNPNTCQCASGWTGNQCQTPICYGTPSDNPSVCSSQGKCLTPNTCVCNSTYTGSQCSIPICFGRNASDTTVCSGCGVCSSPNKCICPSGWIGSECESYTCYGKNTSDSTVCNDRGTCSGLNQCTCNSTHDGNQCENPICFGKSISNPLVCSGLGVCIAPNNCSCSFVGSVGNECGSSLYKWKFPANGLWSNVNNWYVIVAGSPQNASKVPSAGEEVEIAGEGEFTVTMDTNIKGISLITLGSVNGSSLPILSIFNKTLDFTVQILLYSEATLKIVDSTIGFKGISNIDGTINVTNSLLLFQGSTSLLNGKFNFGPNSLVDIGSGTTISMESTITTNEFRFSSGVTLSKNTNLKIQNETNFNGAVTLLESSSLTIYSPTTFRQGFSSSPNTKISCSKKVTFGGAVINTIGGSLNTSATLEFSSGTWILNQTSVSGAASNIVVNDTARVDNQGVFGFYSIGRIEGNGIFSNSGTIVGTSIQEVSIKTFTNSGSFSMSGTTNFTTSPTFSNTVTLFAGSIITLEKDTTFNDARIKGDGKIFVTQNANITLTGKGFMETELNIGANLLVDGDITIRSPVFVGAAGSIHLRPNSIINIDGPLTLDGSIVGSGTLNATSAVEINNLDTTFTFPSLFGGPIKISGSARFTGATTFYSSSSISLAIGSTLTFDAISTFNPNLVQGEGTVNFNTDITFSSPIKVNTTMNFAGNIILNSEMTSFGTLFSLANQITLGSNADLKLHGVNQFISTNLQGNGKITSFGTQNWGGNNVINVPYVSGGGDSRFLSGLTKFMSSVTVKPGSTWSVNGILSLEGSVSVSSSGTPFTGLGTLKIAPASIFTVDSTIFHDIMTEVFGNLIIKGTATFQKPLKFIASSTLEIQTGATLNVMSSSDLPQNIIGNGKLSVMIGATLTGERSTKITPQLEVLGDFIVQSDVTVENLVVSSSGNIAIGSAATLISSKSSVISSASSNAIQGAGTLLVQSGVFQFKSGLITVNKLQVNPLGTLSVSDDSLAVLQATETTISNSLINIDGTFVQASSRSFNIIQSTLNLNSKSFQTGSGPIMISSDSLFKNSGVYLVNSTFAETKLFGRFINNGKLIVAGSKPACFDSKLQFTQDSHLILDQGHMKVTGNLNLTMGTFDLDGKLQVDTVVVSSNTGLVRVKNLNIDGNAHFDEAATLIIDVKGVDRGEYSFLNVTKHLKLDSLIYVKLDSYSPSFGDQIHFLSYNSAVITSQVNLIGAPYMTGAFKDFLGKIYLEMVFSAGSAAANGYKCHYLGNGKIFEMNIFDKQQKVALSLTTSTLDGWVGFGFDQNRSLDNSLLVIASGRNRFQVKRHATIDQDLERLIDIGSGKASTIFQIGAQYLTISMFLPLQYLSQQNLVYYAENRNQELNSTSSSASKHDYIEVFDFKILTDQPIDCTNFLQPSRAEIYSIPATVLVLVLYIVLAILCLIFMKFQPMSSRGLSPVLSLFFLGVQLLVEIRNYFPITSFQGSLCFYLALGYYPLQQICFLLILMYFLRYFSVITMNEDKNMISRALLKDYKTEITKYYRWRIRIFKVLSNTWLTLLMVGLSYFFFVFVFTIVLASSSFVCRFGTLVALRIVNCVMLIILYAATVGTFLSDVIKHYREVIQCHWIQYIIRSDPYYFRLQIALFIPFMIFSFGVELYILITSVSFINVITNYVGHMAFNTIICTILLLIEVVFPLVMTIGHLIYNCIARRGGIQDEELSKVLSNPVLEALFIEYAQKEYSVENIMCYKDIQDYKKKKVRPASLYDKYLNGADSVMEINCTNEEKQAVYKRLGSERFEDNLFDNIEKTLMQNMKDTWSRFRYSPPYLLWKKTDTLQHEMLNTQ